ncbi:type VI secretion system baseplate subunit TssF [Yersinia bercovieri]|uniref:type VI secretion system baseplate subunit TssF n=1 Tax=Yersinia bercovieri TaxID=634 RepID=UPI0011A2B286|nr:type VI secretion system baseplate subunit TssF [Yersinia bercovieri]
MDTKLLNYYNRELAYLREMGTEFSERYPKVAGRLGMHGIEVADPYIERLLEGFAFLTSRIQLKMDDEFPNFSQHLLEILYPNYLSPTPSIAIAELQPDISKGDISGGFVVPRGTRIDSSSLKKSGITCSYTTAHNVTLQPIRLKQIELTGIPTDIPLSTLDPHLKHCVSALRIRLECDETVTLNDMKLDQLVFFLAGPDQQAVQLLELLMQHNIGVVYQTVEEQPQRWLLAKESLRQEGFEPEQALLPSDQRNFEGYRLLQEYFAFPARFQFFSVNGLPRQLNNKSALCQFEIVVLLDSQSEFLERVVDINHLALHCTPVINLFPKVTERITINDKNHEYHLVVDNIHPVDYEIFSIQRLRASKQDYTQEFNPFYRTASTDSSNYGAYFSQRREQRTLSKHARQHGSRNNYSGSELFVSLVDEHQSPWNSDLKYLTADVLCTNRDLPLMLLQQQGSFEMPDSIPIKQVSLRKGPTPPRPALAEGVVTWRLISQLQLNYLSIMDSDPEQGAESLRQLLGLYGNLSEPAVAKQIQGIRHCRLRPVYRRIPEPGPIVFARGIAIELTVDDQAFSGSSPYLLGSVLEHLFSRLVAINTFTEMTLSSPQCGEIAHWQARLGKRMLI